MFIKLNKFFISGKLNITSFTMFQNLLNGHIFWIFLLNILE